MELLQRLLPSSGVSLGSAPPAYRGPGVGFAVVDVETTGLSPKQSRLVELAVVETDAAGQVTGEWSTLLFPDGPVAASHIHGITAADVASAPRFADIAQDLAARLSGWVVVAHNARFDLAFLRAEFARAGWRMPFLPCLCTLEESRYFLPHLERRRLADCCYACRVGLYDEHSALGDARATAGLLATYLRAGTGRPPLPSHWELLDDAVTVTWPPHTATPLSATPVGRLRDLAPTVTVEPAVAPDSGRRAGRRAADSPVHQFRALAVLLEEFGVEDALPADAPAGLTAYLELLAQTLEDGQLSTDELAALGDLAEAHDLTLEQVMAGHRGFVLALAHRALEDGHVSKAENADLAAVTRLLELGEPVVAEVLEQATSQRRDRHIAACKPLPADWELGEPLRVGDRVAFTGCDPDQRTYLEQQAQACGVRVMGNVSSRTALLVTDGSYDGNKAAAARTLGTRVISPDEFAVLVAHVQPPSAASSRTATTPAHPQEHALVDPADVRAWARANGHPVGTRGRLPAEVIQAYLGRDTAS